MGSLVLYFNSRTSYNVVIELRQTEKIVEFEIVQCEVRWYAMFGYSGNELSPAYETFGIFVSRADAERALAEAGWTRKSTDWRDHTGYGSAYIERVVWEI